jgi:prophage maintenance system killer protein
MNDIRFLTVDDICLMHDLAIAEYGGSSGIRDLNLLKSAVAQPEMYVTNQRTDRRIL